MAPEADGKSADAWGQVSQFAARSKSGDAAIDLAEEPPFELAGLSVQPATLEVSKGDRREAITPRVMQALVALARQPGKVLSRDALIEQCWDGRIVGEDAITNCIAKVRRIGESHQAFAIDTVARVGYRLIPADAAEPAPATVRSPRRLWLSIAAALVVAVLVALAAASAMLRPAPLRVSMGEFKSQPGDGQAAALNGRIHDRISALLTANRVDVTVDKGPHARLLITGAADASGGVAHVRIKLEDQDARLVLWQHEFAGPVENDTPLPEQIAARVTQLIVLSSNLVRANGGRLRATTLKSYILGVDGDFDGRPFDEVAYFRSLRDSYPKLAQANAVYAQALFSGADAQPPEIAAAWRKEAEAVVRRAIKLDPSFGNAYYVLAWSRPGSAYDERQSIIQDGLKHAPSHASLNVSEGLFLAEVGRPLEGLAYIRRGQTFDPLAPMKNFGNATYFAAVGSMDEARQQLLNSRRVWPDSPNVGRFFTIFAVNFAEPDEGEAMIQSLQADNPTLVPEADLWRDYFHSLRCHCDGHAIGERILAALMGRRIPLAIAFPALSRLGEMDLAFQAARQPSVGYSFYYRRFLFMPATAPMRREARFMDLAGDLGLVDYWRKSDKWPEFCAEPGLPYDCKVEAARVAARRLGEGPNDITVARIPVGGGGG